MKVLARRRAAVLLAVTLCGSLVACGDDAGDEAPASLGTDATESPVPGLSPEPSSTPEPTATGASTPEAQEPAELEPFAESTGVAVEEATGGPLTVTAVRVARQDGYDRVVFELAGEQPGEPGWRVEHVDDPSHQGSGDPVDVDGESALSVTITGTGYPFDTGQQEVSEAPALPADLRVVTDLELGGVFEGQYEAFIGTSSQAPFRVFRLSDPARVVVDVSSA